MKNILASTSRRNFLVNSGKGILASTVLAPFLSSSKQPLPLISEQLNDTVPIKLSSLDAPSEKGKGNFPAPMNPDKRIGYAIVGLGRLSLGNILPAFGRSQFARPVALVSGDAAKAAKVAEQYGIKPSSIYNYENYDSMASNKEIEAVYIVLPNSMHAEYTIRAAKAGKHVLCEKPMATSVGDAKKMVDACKKANKKLMVAYRVQYEPHNHLMKEWVRNKKFGTAKIIEMFNGQNIGDPTQWRLKKALSGGGALPDIGIYCLNTARYLTGEEPNWVLASSYTTPNDERFREVEESVLFQLRFPSGILVNATTSYGVHECRRYRCLADNGAWFGMDPAFPYNGLEIEMEEVKEKKGWKEMPSIPEKDQFALEMDHFAQCIMHDKQPYTPGEEGLQDQKIMEAIYQSAKEGRPVTLETITAKDRFRGSEPKYD
jgi:predicted dehydrogenase